MGIIKGHDLMLFMGGKSIGYATSHTLEITGNSAEISHKDVSNYWQAVVVQNMSWTATTENLYSLDTDHGKTLADLFDAMKSLTEVELVFSQKAASPTAPPFSSSVPKFSGNALITSLSLNAPDGDNATFSCSFTGNGPLAYTPASGAPDVQKDGGIQEKAKKETANEKV
jgi:TP901-1 family phage major tail protein